MPSQAKSTKQNLPNYIYWIKSTKPNVPNQIKQTMYTEQNLLNQIFWTHSIGQKLPKKREMTSDISGGIFQPRGITATSEWLPRYRHHAPAPMLWPIRSQNSQALASAPWLQQPIRFWIHSARQKGHSRYITWHLSLPNKI